MGNESNKRGVIKGCVIQSHPVTQTIAALIASRHSALKHLRTGRLTDDDEAC